MGLNVVPSSNKKAEERDQLTISSDEEDDEDEIDTSDEEGGGEDGGDGDGDGKKGANAIGWDMPAPISKGPSKAVRWELGISFVIFGEVELLAL